MDKCLKDIKTANKSIKLNTIKSLKQQMHQCRIKSFQQSNQFDNNTVPKEAKDQFDNNTMPKRAKEAVRQDSDRLKWGAPVVLKYLSLVIVVWIFFAIYSYLHNRCMLYGGSNCVHMNPFTFQNCHDDNFAIF